MKNLIFISVCSMVLLCGKAKAQTGPVFSATGGCTSVTTANTPSYRGDLWGGGLWNIGEDEPCVFLLYILNRNLVAEYTLQRLNPSNNTWVHVAGPQINSSFHNISTHGTYRVNVSCPVLFTNEQCPDGIDVRNNGGQYLGQIGTYTNGIFATSNTVVVGATTPSDISYTFIDIPETGAEAAYDFGEVAQMNTSASQNYNLWWLAIFEDGPTYQRYRSNGWTNGTVPNNVFNLTPFWEGGFNWKFETFHTYTVQFVIENAQCRNGIEQNPPQTWNVLARTFFICPAGSGCRIGEDAQKIVLSPNPASSVVRLLHFEIDAGREYRLTISDLAGRMARSMTLTSNEVDISGFGRGMYAVTIERDGKRIFTDKLVINQ